MRVLLLDDETLHRKGLVSLLSMHQAMKTVGEARNKQEALVHIQRENPELVIMDFYVGNESGLEVISEARKKGCTCKFAILTNSNDPELFEQAKMMGVDGYISLGVSPEEFIYALNVIKSGRKYYDPDVLELLMNSKTKPKVDRFHLDRLTPKEKEVLRSLGLGMTNKEISESLFVTENTVKKHVSQVLAKLEIGDRTRAALYANEAGIVHFSSIS